MQRSKTYNSIKQLICTCSTGDYEMRISVYRTGAFPQMLPYTPLGEEFEK